MTPDKNFRLKPRYKASIALMGGSKEDRNQFKNMMIQAQLHEEAAIRAALKSKDNSIGSRPQRGAPEPAADA